MTPGKPGKQAKTIRSPVSLGVPSPPDIAARWERPFGQIGLALLFLCACAFGVLEVHYSNDTWIGLAAGRQILHSAHFPTTDQFSYTFYGQPWFNPNWLSHVFFWALYDKMGPTAVVVGTWLAGGVIFSMVLLAVRFRAGSTMAAVLAASVTAMASRDWLSIRPATIQFLLLSALWLCFSALLSQGTRRRWWPVVLLLPVLGLWCHAHGSFLFAFGVLGLFLGCGVLTPRLRGSPVTTGRQLMAAGGIGLLAAFLGIVLSPYGVENFLHPFKVVESQVFRTVGEWMPPYRASRFPSVVRFWAVLAAVALSPLVILFLRTFDDPRRPGRKGTRPDASGAGPAPGFQVMLFDLASVVLGLSMVMFARRFAPVFYIMSAPALATWILRLAQTLSQKMRRRLRIALLAGSWIGAVALASVTIAFAHRDLIAHVPGSGRYDLLDRVTEDERTPREAIQFLAKNGLTPNLMTEWKVAGSVMFFAPGARVYIDGRAQQVYTEQHYLQYVRMMDLPESQEDQIIAALDKAGTDAVLLPKWESVHRLSLLIQRRRQWLQILETPQAFIWVRQGSPLMSALAEREKAGLLWWPDLPNTVVPRGGLLTITQPPENKRAIEVWQAGAARDPELGLSVYSLITKAFLHEGEPAEAARYLSQERARLEGPGTSLSEELRQGLLQELRRSEGLITGRAAEGTPAGRK